jgi:hypothetical protein
MLFAINFPRKRFPFFTILKSLNSLQLISILLAACKLFLVERERVRARRCGNKGTKCVGPLQAAVLYELQSERLGCRGEDLNLL